MPLLRETFDPFSVELSGSNLIEASAGTGKTYSIAVLTLRLILNKQATIREILMVTFTNAAAAEMDLRIRLFLRQALHVAEGKEEGIDQKIVELVKQSRYPTETIFLLKQALMEIDQASILTIHSFCAKILSEFAFESGQFFSATTLHPEDYSELETDAINQVWREKVTTLDKEIIWILKQNKFSRELILSLVKGATSGKRIYTGIHEENYNPEIKLSNEISIIKEILSKNLYVDQSELKKQIEQKEQDLLLFIKDHWNEWKDKAMNEGGRVKTHLLPLFESNQYNALFDKLNKSPSQYVKNFFSAILWGKVNQIVKIREELSIVKDADKERQENLSTLSYKITALIAEIIANKVVELTDKLKVDTGTMTFDDMINHLHKVLVDKLHNETSLPLIAHLRERYNAVFIDEFQDTDKLQFDIFYHLFQLDLLPKRPILFYIGDPKQSIYAFRKADLATYFRASDTVHMIHRMNVNYRSTDFFIEAMNTFFSPTDQFDVFLSNKMQYHKVNFPPNQRKTGGLFYSGRILEPMSVAVIQENNIASTAANLIARLLYDDNFTIQKNQDRSRIKPSDIGLLVRTKVEARQMKEALSQLSIPAITIDDSKVLRSQESKEVLHFLQAINEISRGTINRALLTTLGGYKLDNINLLNDEDLSQRFRTYQEIWKKDGIYVLLRTIVSDFSLLQRTHSDGFTDGERTLANIFQIMEILHGIETTKKHMPDELIFWLKKALQGENKSGDEYNQRIESDEATVKIVTIHSSKGLEYNIVVAPFLQMTTSNSHQTCQFYDLDSYYVAQKSLIKDTDKIDLYTEQSEQENRRLLYVAITRAKYHCYVLTNNIVTKKDTLANHLIPLLRQQNKINYIRFFSDLITIEGCANSQNIDLNAPEFLPVSKNKKKEQESNLEWSTQIAIPSVIIHDADWQKTSYSALKRESSHISVKASKNTIVNQYDQFVFEKLKKGAQTGDLLHYIFERIDFTAPDTWEKITRQALKRYHLAEPDEDNISSFHSLINTVLSTQLTTNEAQFSLQEVTKEQRISELEFDIPLSRFSSERIPSVIDGDIPLGVKEISSISGILNGKIDLLFRYNNQYFLVDWKSNYLGDRIEDYETSKIRNAMEEHHYYLQYYLYSLALNRYFKKRDPSYNYSLNFGGIFYLFLRGMRTTEATGIYFHKPSEESITQLDQILFHRPINTHSI